MLNFHREVNLCEEVRPYQVANVFSIPQYVEIGQYFQKDGKDQQSLRFSRQGKELESKKVSEFYIIRVGDLVRISCIVLNFNKNYTLSPEEKRDITSIFTLFNSDTPEIKYKTVKTQIISKLTRSS